MAPRLSRDASSSSTPAFRLEPPAPRSAFPTSRPNPETKPNGLTSRPTSKPGAPSSRRDPGDFSVDPTVRSMGTFSDPDSAEDEIVSTPSPVAEGAAKTQVCARPTRARSFALSRLPVGWRCDRALSLCRLDFARRPSLLRACSEELVSTCWFHTYWGRPRRPFREAKHLHGVPAS
jgi:hypothetical protein